MQRKDMPRWDRFVLRCEDATFFHRSGWKDVIENAFGHKTWFLYFEAQDEIQGILPLAEVKSRLFGHSLSALPFCVYGGIAATNDIARQALHTTAQSLARAQNVDYLEYRNIKAHDPGWRTKSLYVTFRKQILAGVEENMAAIPRKQRAMVRKGIKAGLQSRIDTGIDSFYPVYAQSMHRLGTPVPSKKYFALLKQTFGDDCEVMTIIREGRAVSSVMSFYFRDEVLPYYGGGTDEAREVAGNDFMYWELMRRACERGSRVFDFGRSKTGTGSFAFKKNWGFEPQPLRYEYLLCNRKKVPDISPLNPKYKLLIRAWKVLPLPLANSLGPHIFKYLG